MDPTLIVIVVALAAILFFTFRNSAKRRQKAIARREATLDAPTNTLAIVALVLSFFAAVPAVICGHVALGQMRRVPERGWGLAVASLWIGYVFIAASLAGATVWLVLLFTR